MLHHHLCTRVKTEAAEAQPPAAVIDTRGPWSARMTGPSAAGITATTLP